MQAMLEEKHFFPVLERNTRINYLFHTMGFHYL